jgi:hypothetical protein
MTIDQMIHELRARGVPDNMYLLDGNLGVGEQYGIEHTDAGWLIYYSERGKKRAAFRFDDESAACTKFLEIISDMMRRMSDHIRRNSRRRP